MSRGSNIFRTSFAYSKEIRMDQKVESGSDLLERVLEQQPHATSTESKHSVVELSLLLANDEYLKLEKMAEAEHISIAYLLRLIIRHEINSCPNTLRQLDVVRHKYMPQQ